MGLWATVLAEFKAILSDKAIAITLFGGVVFYALLYPLPYLNQVPTEQQLIVVDKDHSSLSRQLIRHADASPKLAVVAQVSDIEQAKMMIALEQAHGFLVIPEGFRRDLLRRQSVALAYGGDANYFLIYSTIIEGLVAVGMESEKSLRYIGLVANGQNPKQVARDIAPIHLNSVPAFNPSLGYTAYVVPGVLLLVLHQTLLIGTGILGAGQWREQGYWQQISIGQLLIARLATFGLIYSLFTSFYFGICYYAYDVNTHASIGLMALFLLPVILATSLAGVAISCLFTRRDLPTQIMLLLSMPILFLSGFIWPLELIPAPLVYLSQLIPAVPGIQGILQLNQLGADWSAVAPLWLQLWGLAFGYLLLALVGMRWRLR